MPKSSASGKGASNTKRNDSSKKNGAFVDHDAAMEFLRSRENVERVHPNHIDKRVWELGRMRALLEALGNPHDRLEIVHIAGSKGKGSSCNMLEGALQTCGYTTGVFTSPHLLSVFERVRVGGEPIESGVFDKALSLCRDAASAVESDPENYGRVTYFEILTGLAFVVFAQEAVDLVVLETGIGGRVDCTNVVTPIVCGITNIQLEHTQVLGDTIELIASEKAGIMKPGVVTVCTPQEDIVEEVFTKHGEQVGCPVKVLGRDVLYTKRFQSGSRGGPHTRVCVGDGSDGFSGSGEGTGTVGFEHMPVPLMGMHQADNCALVLGIVLELRRLGYDLPERNVMSGFEQMNRNGRLECVMKKPRMYIDGAHTPSSVRETLLAVGAHLDYDSLIVIFGCAQDKDVEGMLKELDRGADKVYFTQASDNPRAMDPDALYELFLENEHRVMAESKACVKDAVNSGAQGMSGNDLILVLGSFYLAGELKSLVEARKSKR